MNVWGRGPLLLGALLLAGGAAPTARAEGSRYAPVPPGLDAVVGSGRDPSERYDPDLLSVPPRLVVRTNSLRGGSYETDDGRGGTFDPATPPGPVVDAYGAGDCFAAGLTYALGASLSVEEAIAIAARCGAWNVAGRGPYSNQLSGADL